MIHGYAAEFHSFWQKSIFEKAQYTLDKSFNLNSVVSVGLQAPRVHLAKPILALAQCRVLPEEGHKPAFYARTRSESHGF